MRTSSDFFTESELSFQFLQNEVLLGLPATVQQSFHTSEPTEKQEQPGYHSTREGQDLKLTMNPIKRGQKF